MGLKLEEVMSILTQAATRLNAMNDMDRIAAIGDLLQTIPDGQPNQYLRVLAESFNLDPTTPEYRELLACLLARLDPAKPLGTPLYNAIARHSIGLAFEACLFRVNPETGESEIYLTQRAPGDTAYPNLWHCPGTIYRPGVEPPNTIYKSGDGPEAEAAHRLAKREFGVESFQAYRRVGEFYWVETRGSLQSRVFLVDLPDGVEPTNERGRWWSVDMTRTSLEVIKSHREVIIPLGQAYNNMLFQARM